MDQSKKTIILLFFYYFLLANSSVHTTTRLNKSIFHQEALLATHLRNSDVQKETKAQFKKYYLDFDEDENYEKSLSEEDEN